MAKTKGMALAEYVSSQPLSQQDLQHPAFLTSAMRMGLERSMFEPLRFIQTRSQLGYEEPERLFPLPFSNQISAVKPGPTFTDKTGWLKRSYGQTANLPAFLASGMGSAPDPGDIDPETGKPREHQPSLFKTMASATRFLPYESVAPQLGMPFQPPKNMVFDTQRGTWTYGASPSEDIVQLIHNYNQLLTKTPEELLQSLQPKLLSETEQTLKDDQPIHDLHQQYGGMSLPTQVPPMFLDDISVTKQNVKNKRKK